MQPCPANHLIIKRPTNCKTCGEFICNKCNGEGAPFGCKGVDSRNGTIAFSCGKRISNARCCAHLPQMTECYRCDRKCVYTYREDHPFVRQGDHPCEACICGLWSRNTCPKCHDEGAPNGNCVCFKKLKREYCSCKGLDPNCKECDISGDYNRPPLHAFHEQTRGMCMRCSCDLIAEWRNEIKGQTVQRPVAMFVNRATTPPRTIVSRPTDTDKEKKFIEELDLVTDPLDDEFECQEEPKTYSAKEIQEDVETVLKILQKYPPGYITIK